MNIALIGYGKMGQTIEKILIARGHSVSFIADSPDNDLRALLSDKNPDVCIEFTGPESAMNNIKICLSEGIPVVSGSTGWLEHLPYLKKYCEEVNGCFFYASNFSIGVNLFFHVNKIVAELMNSYPEYDVHMKETHHIHKKDSPSGTAITLSDLIIDRLSRKTSWKEADNVKEEELKIEAIRQDEVPGTHNVIYNSDVDEIELIHRAHSRKGFAQGAVEVAEWLPGKKGFQNMDNYLGI